MVATEHAWCWGAGLGWAWFTWWVGWIGGLVNWIVGPKAAGQKGQPAWSKSWNGTGFNLWPKAFMAPVGLGRGCRVVCFGCFGLSFSLWPRF